MSLIKVPFTTGDHCSNNVVQHDSGIRARFYNDPVGDWQINDNPELLPAGVNVSTKGRASYVTFSQQNNATRLKLRNLFVGGAFIFVCMLRCEVGIDKDC